MQGLHSLTSRSRESATSVADPVGFATSGNTVKSLSAGPITTVEQGRPYPLPAILSADDLSVLRQAKLKMWILSGAPRAAAPIGTQRLSSSELWFPCRIAKYAH